MRTGERVKGTGVAALLVAMVVGAGLAAGCSKGVDTTDEDLQAGDRAIIGRARPYAADLGLAARDAELASSQKARRDVAWKALAKILVDAPIAETTATANGAPVRIPTFRTWYHKDDFERMFARAYTNHGAEKRKARAPLAEATINEVFDWNAKDRGLWTEKQYFERVAQADTEGEAQGLGGNGKVSYDTNMVRHLMRSWSGLSKCVRGEVTDDPLLQKVNDVNFTTCMEEEVPRNAAVTKVSWLRSDFGFTVPVRPTTPAVLKDRLSGVRDDGGWGGAEGEATPGPQEIYTVTMSDGASFRMPALHLVTKELREWLWITIWWSPEPDTDFGADRPAEITNLAGPWKNYKMCVVTAYDERDPDPTGGYPTGPGSLGDALAAVHPGAGAKGPSWCSNPYLERGKKNAQTNCIGCHQHGGTQLASFDILDDETRFPKAGRTQVRGNFPADYLFAATSPPESLGSIIDQQVTHFQGIDP